MSDFDPEQKRYLEGFASGVQAARVDRRPGAAPAAPAAARADRPRRDPPQGAGQTIAPAAASSPIRRSGSAPSTPSTPMRG